MLYRLSTVCESQLEPFVFKTRYLDELIFTNNFFPKTDFNWKQKALAETHIQ